MGRGRKNKNKKKVGCVGLESTAACLVIGHVSFIRERTTFLMLSSAVH